MSAPARSRLRIVQRPSPVPPRIRSGRTPPRQSFVRPPCRRETSGRARSRLIDRGQPLKGYGAIAAHRSMPLAMRPAWSSLHLTANRDPAFRSRAGSPGTAAFQPTLAHRAKTGCRAPVYRHAPRSTDALPLPFCQPTCPLLATARACFAEKDGRLFQPSRNLFMTDTLEIGVQQDPIATAIFCCVHGRIGTLNKVALELGVLAEDCYPNTDAQMLDSVWRTGKKF